MTRLRQDLSDTQVNQIVKLLLDHTLEVLGEFDFEITIVTADKKLTDKDYPHSFVYDNGKDLNLALSQAIEKIEGDQFMIVMPDLPGLKAVHISRILELAKLHDNIIANTEDMGTAVALIPRSLIEKGHLGPKSASKIITNAHEENIPLANIQIQELRIDLDSIDDLKFWKNKLSEMGFSIEL